MRTVSITLTTMRYFVEVARYESFTSAASRLYTAQSNLSKNISGLERSLGVELFFRDGRYVRLTDAGKLIYKEWSAALEKIDQSILHARQMEQERNDTVTIGVLEGMSITPDASERFRELQKRSPGVKIVLERGDLNDIWQKFEAGKYDIIATSELHDSPHTVPPSCVRHVLNTCYGVVAINAGSPMTGHSALTLSMLRDESFVALSLENSPEGYRIIQEACRQAGFEPRITREAASIETLILYVEMGVGAAIMGGNNRLASNSNIRLIPLEDIRFDTAVYWRADPTTSAIQAIKDII